MGAVNVLLVDDHAVVRQGLRRLLESDPDIEVVGEASDGRRATDMAERLRPNVVVMDISLPELNGIEATREIMRRHAGANVLILSMHSDEVFVRQSLKAGARGYLLKDAEALDLQKAVKVVGQGGSFFSPAASNVLLGSYLSEAHARQVEDDLALLSDREREVLQGVAEGKTNKEIATRFSVNVHTVETHRRVIMEKLGLRNTAEIVRFAVRKKLVE
jgi:two-component system response regulator NreC